MVWAMVRAAIKNSRSRKLVFVLLLRWIRANLTVGTFLFGVLSAGATGLISGTLYFSSRDQRIAAAEDRDTRLSARVDLLEADFKQRDVHRARLASDLGLINGRLETLTVRINTDEGRFAAIDTWVADAQGRREAYKTTLGAIDTRLGVLDAQMAYLSAFIRDNTTLGHGIKR
jgi:hypothetical protein